MPHELIATEDGSVTLYVPELNEHYHSVHGAIQESKHIFIQAGMDYYLENHPAGERQSLHILEAGFGTGLNALLTLLHTAELQVSVHYHSIEKYPLRAEEIAGLNYPEQIGASCRQPFHEIHACPWEEEVQIAPHFRLCKHCNDFREIDFPPRFDIIYFDAFNPDVQPHLWTEEVFARFYGALKPEGILVTYCVKGIVKQALRHTGFTLKRLPGPPGKREMLRATKPAI